jgi:hypothetical protein
MTPQGDEMRYQVDRKVETLIDGALKTLELTEVRPNDAALYKPVQPPKIV